MGKNLCISLVIMASLGNLASAGSCGTTSYSSYTTYSSKPHYVAKVKEVVTPIAVPVYVPSYTFQYAAPTQYDMHYAPPVPAAIPVAAPAYYPPQYPAHFVQPVIMQQQKSCAAPMGAASYGTCPVTGKAMSNGNGYGNNGNGDIRSLARALLEEMSKQSNSNGNDTGPPMAMVVPPSGPAPIAPPPNGNGGNGNEAMAMQLGGQALARNCASCHTGIGSRGDTVIFTQPGVISTDAPWKSIIKEIEGGRMPPKSSQYRITAEEYEWIKQLALVMTKK